MAGVVSAGLGGQQFEDDILLNINATLMEVYTQAPDDWLSRVPRAEVVKAPTTVSITTTQDSKAVTFADYQSWMLGCTIIIEGDSAQNQITIDAAAPVSLVKPFNGTSGTHTARVYHDAITLLADVIEIGSPVMLDQQWELIPAAAIRDLQTFQPGDFRGYGYGATRRPTWGGNYPLRTTDKRVVRPESFMVNRRFAYNAAQTLQFGLSSLPDSRYTLDYQAKVFPFVSSLSDTTRPEYLPFRYDEAILLPWLRYNFSAHPNVTISQAQLKPRFDQAVVMLKSIEPQQFHPQIVDITTGW